MDKKGEQLRENMYKVMDKHGHDSKEALVASQVLDQYMNNYSRENN